MFYIVPIEIFRQHHENPLGTHFSEAYMLHLPDGIYGLVRASFTNATKLKQFESHASVICLPHAYSGKPVGPVVAKHLSHLGISDTHTTFDVAEKAAAEHPKFKLRHW